MTSTPTPKPLFCRDCKWARPHIEGWEGWPSWGGWPFSREVWTIAKCARPNKDETWDPVSGELTQNRRYCGVERDPDHPDPDRCGPEAKYFQPKKGA